MTPLRQRFSDDLRLRNYATKTIDAYVGGVARFAGHFGRSPDRLDAEHVRSCQLYLLSLSVSWSLFNQTVCGLRFFFAVTCGRPGLWPAGAGRAVGRWAGQWGSGAAARGALPKRRRWTGGWATG